MEKMEDWHHWTIMLADRSRDRFAARSGSIKLIYLRHHRRIIGSLSGENGLFLILYFVFDSAETQEV